MEGIARYEQPKKRVPDEFVPKQEIPTDITPKIIKGNLQRLPHRDFKLLIIILILILLGQVFRKKKYSFSLDFNRLIRSSESREILTAIIPYLDTDEQQNVYTILGLLEALDIIYGVADGTYQEVKISNTPILFSSEKERVVGILKAVKPYVSEPSKELVDNVIKAQTMSSQLARNIRIYRSKRLSGQSLLDSLDPIYDTLEALRPIIPSDQYEQIDKIVGLSKLFEAGDLKSPMPDKKNYSEIDNVENSITDSQDEDITIDDNPTDNIPAKRQEDAMEALIKMINLFS